MFLFHRQRPRSFSYIPRFYREEDDPERKRIQFTRKTFSDPRGNRANFFSILLFFVLILLLFGYLLPKLNTVQVQDTIISPADVIPIETQK
ncbi:hypothetical protein KKA00_11830 [bacterium]|nr:hypothetical protein [bacterium]MBU1652904.1 hypothetical protein [bacterium]